MNELALPTQPEDPGDDLGPPVLLKRLGNAVEANLARAKLATAGIPSFLGGENVFSDQMTPLHRREVELYVPESMVADAIDVLDAPPLEPMPFEPYPAEDPGRSLSFRAFVSAVIGWLAFFLATFGFLLAVPAFVYAIYLGAAGLTRSVERTPSITIKCVTAIGMAIAGLLAAGFVAFEVVRM